MANDIPQARNTAPQVPERILRIDGERTAAMYTLAIRVARLDSRFRELAGNPSVEGRKQYRAGNEGFARAIGVFEDALMQVEKDVDMNSRRGNRQGNQPQRREPQVRPQKQSTAPAASSKPAAESKPAQAPKAEPQTAAAPAVEATNSQVKQPQKPAPKPAQQNPQKPKGPQSKPQAKNPQQQQAKQKADVATVTL